MRLLLMDMKLLMNRITPSLLAAPVLAVAVFGCPAAVFAGSPQPGAAGAADGHDFAAVPKMVIPVKLEDRAAVNGGSILHYSFVVKNEGKKDLHILDVQPSCHCTVASFDKVIAPGKSGKIDADVDIPPMAEGKVSKTLTVYSDDPVDQSETLFLIASVTPVISILPQPMVTVSYSDDKPIVRTFTVESRKKEPLELTGPAVSGPITVDVKKDPKTANKYSVTVTLTPPPSGGDAMGQVELNTNMPEVPPVHLTLYALGDMGITFTPPSINFGIIGPLNPNPHATMGMFSRKAEFHIQTVESDDPALLVTYTKLAGVNSSWYNLSAAYAGGWKKGLHQGFIIVHTDLSRVPIVKVPYQADVQ